MKKLLLLASVFFVFPVAAQEVCTESIVYAVGSDGQCETFKNSCVVPDDWKTVPSCESVRPKRFGRSPDELAKLRAQGRARSMRSKRRMQDKKPERRSNNTYSRAGRGKFMSRTGAERRVRSKKDESAPKGKVRGRSMPKFGNAKAYSRYKKTLNRGGFKVEGDQTAREIFKEKKAKWGSNRPNLRARTDVIREGYLKNEPDFQERQKNRMKTLGGRKNAATHFAELRRKRREALGPKTPRSARLKRRWTGDRLEGDLNQRLRD